jgi:hypothetical protein
MCLENIIGLTNSECPCISTPDVNNSLSGYFINDILESGTVLKLDANLACDDPIWNVYKAARTRAIEDFKINLMGLISQYNSKLVEWSGFIGNVEKATKIITNAPASYEFKINPRFGYKSTKFTFTPFFKGADIGTIEVKLFKNGNPTAVKVWSINTIPGQLVSGLSSETIEMFTNEVPNYYTLEVNLNGVRPYETKTYCCSGPARWNMFMDLPQKQMYGLALNGKLHCGTEWICGEWDYSNDPWAKTMARTILFMARVYIYQYIISSSKVNKYSLLLEPEHLMGKIKNHNKQIEDRIEWLSQNLPTSAQDCWTCSPSITVGQIIV